MWLVVTISVVSLSPSLSLSVSLGRLKFVSPACGQESYLLHVCLFRPDAIWHDYCMQIVMTMEKRQRQQQQLSGPSMVGIRMNIMHATTTTTTITLHSLPKLCIEACTAHAINFKHVKETIDTIPATRNTCSLMP